MLSADNTTGAAWLRSRRTRQEETAEPTDERSLPLVRRLGASAEEQVSTLADGVPSEQLTQLIEELHAYV